jgi:molybdenum cofactor cytidylyltransferase
MTASSSATGRLPLAAVILAAGASSRMGRPKLLLAWAGSTVIGHLISQWRGLGAAQIAVVLRPDDAVLAKELERLGFPNTDLIPNPQPERGMFSSIVCAAGWPGWRSEISRWAIALGDQPHLRTETLRQLLDLSAANPDALCQPAFAGRTAHPVILPLPVFRSLQGARAETLKDFLKRAAVRRVQCPVNDSGLVLDLDTPEDYINILASNSVA